MRGQGRRPPSTQPPFSLRLLLAPGSRRPPRTLLLPFLSSSNTSSVFRFFRFRSILFPSSCHYLARTTGKSFVLGFCLSFLCPSSRFTIFRNKSPYVARCYSAQDYEGFFFSFFFCFALIPCFCSTASKFGSAFQASYLNLLVFFTAFYF